MCDGFGKSHFLTFDKIDYSFSSNCSYVLLETRDKFLSRATSHVRVLVSNEPCHELSLDSCVKGVTILYGGHAVAVQGKGYKDLEVTLDQKEVERFPYATDLFNVTWIPGTGVEIIIPEVSNLPSISNFYYFFFTCVNTSMFYEIRPRLMNSLQSLSKGPHLSSIWALFCAFEVNSF